MGDLSKGFTPFDQERCLGDAQELILKSWNSQIRDQQFKCFYLPSTSFGQPKFEVGVLRWVALRLYARNADLDRFLQLKSSKSSIMLLQDPRKAKVTDWCHDSLFPEDDPGFGRPAAAEPWGTSLGLVLCNSIGRFSLESRKLESMPESSEATKSARAMSGADQLCVGRCWKGQGGDPHLFAEGPVRAAGQAHKVNLKMKM